VRSPSVIGDGDAEFPSSPRAFWLPCAISRRHCSLPSVPKHISKSLRSSTVVRKIWSSQTTGVAPAGPGNSTRHATLLSSDHWVGMFFSLEIPFRVGPRHDPQFSARQSFAAMTSSRVVERMVVGFIGGSLVDGNDRNARVEYTPIRSRIPAMRAGVGGQGFRAMAQQHRVRERKDSDTQKTDGDQVAIGFVVFVCSVVV